jgi:hypothetical protein
MKGISLVLAVLCLAAAALGCARTPGCPVELTMRAPAYEAQPLAAYSGSTEGTLTAVAADRCSLKVRELDGQLRSVQLTSATRVLTPGGASASRQDLTPGQRVRVSYRTYGRSLVADQVELQPSPEGGGAKGDCSRSE